MKLASVFRTAAFLLCLVWVAGALSSCQKKVEEELMEKAIEQSTGSDVELNTGSGRVSIESDGQKIEIQQQGATWPDDMPSDVPKFAYGTLKAVTRTQTGGADAWTVTCEDVPENSIKAYEALLKSRGFETTLTIVTSDTGSGGSLQASKGPVTVFLLGDNRAVSLSVSREKK